MIKAERINLKKCQKCHHPLLYPTPIPRILGLLIFYIWSFQRPDSYISALEERVKVVEDKFEIVMNLEERLSKIESEDNAKHIKMVELKEKCFQCDFETTSKHGLKVHIAKKHTVRSTFSCEFCERIFENEKDMRKHLKTHLFLES